MTQQPTTDLEQRLQALEAAQVQQQARPASLDDALASIDPADSESALKLFNWLLKNGRLHKMGTLDGVGFMMAYQEPKGSTREGSTNPSHSRYSSRVSTRSLYTTPFACAAAITCRPHSKSSMSVSPPTSRNSIPGSRSAASRAAST